MFKPTSLLQTPSLHWRIYIISDTGNTHTHAVQTYLQDLLNTVDGWGEQSADLLVIVDIVGMSQTHEQDVGWQTWDQIHGYTARLQLWRDKRRKKFSEGLRRNIRKRSFCPLQMGDFVDFKNVLSLNFEWFLLRNGHRALGTVKLS